ncbi:uncharacterized protein LOC131250658 [Magnolia sinica]|uniref:uncharacterized protein LOC131250658 n=1 Tax=Magnolia sinica TaxID=86752 RepID=UPI002659B15A|nr:uncharacterized protein LOC131250658 [Magnolia sinica]
MEVYIDDMLVKSVRASNHLTDLGETFTILREYQMKLNPAKCIFGVSSGKFLGFQVSQRGTEANPDKIKALLNMKFTTPSEEEISTEVETTPSPISPSDQKASSELGWVLYVDGSSNAKRAGAGIVLIAPDSTPIQYAIRLSFKASNNEAEYEALLVGLRLAANLGVYFIQVRCDFQLVVNHISTEYEAKETRMIAYLDEVRKLIERYWSCTIHQISKVENSWADALAKLASATDGKISRIIPVEFIEHPSIDQTEKQAVNLVSDAPSWMDPIYSYLTFGEVPSDKLEVKRLRIRAARYIVLDGILYKKGHSQPYLRCL